ncbi:DUF11 domain-containing protein [Geomonas sp. Red69]|uniref:DUF11 domain-containing protein n=1 Tax=Geomonas diazotrophica TaxID=2843197 RepID=UPI001C0F4D0B|nr:MULTISPECIES: DUF11 domain-containing protein [Geomonas]MBU5635292.1 DUF11 domain-containing protein [Geomonas diazotrophica]QXE86791.1 DUF11 domain-containing protein [Geomonas nitrogeniifigens]
MQKNKKLATAAVALILAAMPLVAWAQPKVTITMKAEKEVSVTAKGKQVKKRVAAKGVQPGEEIIYTLSYQNSGNEAAKDVVISDPIPAGTAYIPGSASETGDLAFSIDKGKTFKKPTLLTYELKGNTGKMEKKVASPDEYTDVRWTIPQVPAGGTGSVSFKVKVK